MPLVTEHLLAVRESSETLAVPPSRARLRVPPTHALLAADVDARGAQRTEDTIPLGHMDVELSSDGRLLALESGLPPDAWHASARAPTPEHLAVAPLRDVRLEEAPLTTPVEMDYVSDRDRGIWGAVLVGEHGDIIRVASGVLLEVDDDGRVVGLWLEGVSETDQA